jgi:hypothetical protein
MKRFALFMSTGLALAVVVAAAQALQAPERAPLAPIELPATAAQDRSAAGRNPPTGTATPKLEIKPAATRRQATPKHVVNVVRREPATVKHVVNVVRTQPRAPARAQSLPAPPTGDDGDDDDDDGDDDDD